MNVVHLTASTFFGGPERQMLGLARALPRNYQSLFLSFAEGWRCQPFVDEARRQGFEASWDILEVRCLSDGHVECCRSREIVQVAPGRIHL